MKMAALMSHMNKMKGFHQSCTIKIYLRHKSSDVGVTLRPTNERNNPKESVNQYFYPRRKQQKVRRATSIEKESKSAVCGGRMKYLPEIIGNYVNELVDSKSATGIEKTQTIFLEGQKMIRDALKAGVELKSVYATEKILVERLHLDEGVNQYLTKNKTLKDWVSKQAVQADGIICAVAKKPVSCETESAEKLPVTVVLDRVTEPWTAGVLLKTARGIGCARFATTKGCCNVWDPVVLTASEGSHFHMAIEANLSWNELSEYIDDSCMVVLTSGRQLVWKGLLKAEKNFHEETVEEDEYVEENLLQEYSPGNTGGSIFPVTNFAEVDFSDKKHIILIVSDDILKVSKQKLKFLQENNAILVSIPMVTGISRLNPVVAGVVLMYKLQNQLVTIKH